MMVPTGCTFIFLFLQAIVSPVTKYNFLKSLLNVLLCLPNINYVEGFFFKSERRSETTNTGYGFNTSLYIKKLIKI